MENRKVDLRKFRTVGEEKGKEMNASKKAFDLIAKYEGFRANPYKCPAGVPTIGYGSTFYCDGSRVKLADPEITKEEAYKLMSFHAEDFAKKILSVVKVQLSQNQLDALTSFVYNVGLANFKASRMFAYINDQNFTAAAIQFPKWVYAKKIKLPGLVKRREEECLLFCK